MRSVLLISTLAICTCGCASGQKMGSTLKTATLATGAFLTEGLINGLLDDDRSFSERDADEQREHAWKRYWQDNPQASPTMTDAFADD
jgi:hypothetical protein